MKKIVIGIDVGISTTKIVGIDDNGMVISPIRIKATDPITSLYGAFGKYLHDNKISLNEVEHVMLTGVGAAYIDEPIYGLPTSKSQEFVADGLGARYESKLDRMIVVSMGNRHIACEMRWRRNQAHRRHRHRRRNTRRSESHYAQDRRHQADS